MKRKDPPRRTAQDIFDEICALKADHLGRELTRDERHLMATMFDAGRQWEMPWTLDPDQMVR